MFRIFLLYYQRMLRNTEVALVIMPLLPLLV
jgi:hypothetical protein